MHVMRQRNANGMVRYWSLRGYISGELLMQMLTCDVLVVVNFMSESQFSLQLHKFELSKQSLLYTFRVTVFPLLQQRVIYWPNVYVLHRHPA